MVERRRKPGDEVEASVSALDDLGVGVAEVREAPESLRLHVAGALPGENIVARLDHLSVHVHGARREAWATLLSVRTTSTDRVHPVCSAHGACGGCTLGVLAYPAQIAWKRQRVVAALRQVQAASGVDVDACVPSPVPVGYRNQAKYVYGGADAKGAPILGAFAPRSHRLVDLASCSVVEPILEQVRRTLLDVLVSLKVTPFDEQRRTGDLRYALMRATESGRVMVTLVAARPDWHAANRVCEALVAASPDVVSVILNVNATTGNRLFGDEERTLFGTASIDDSIGDVVVRLSSRSFFQVNRRMAGRIYRDIGAAVPGTVMRAVDVYAGAAPIALSLAPVANEVLAIEENPAATAAAAAFIAERPHLPGRVRMVTGDAALRLVEIESADLVVLNPPRKGCAREVLAAVARLRPRMIAYLSCDPATLARDLALLLDGGARLTRVTPYDMMPHTPHVETLALLTMG